MVKNLFTSTVILLIIPLVFRTADAGCIKDTETIKRIGKTRFHMNKKEASTYENALNACSSLRPKNKHRIAHIESIEEDVIIGKWLTAHLRKNTLNTPRFYIGAKYNAEKKAYLWNDGNTTLKYHNLNEMFGKPIGRVDGCLTVAFPYPKEDIYGWGYTWDVVPCNSLQFALCECTDDDAENSNMYDKEKELYEGVFPLAQRRFTLTWERMNYDEATKFCKDHDLELYKPSNADSCIFTFIKEHRQDVTKFHFWASRPKNPTENEPKFCPTAVYAYENHNECNCKWRYLVTAPADCSLKNAVICEKPGEKDKLVDLKKCEFDNQLIELDRKGDIYRSEIKADYLTAAAWCRKNRLQLVTFPNMQKIGFELKTNYKYDKLADYWIFNKNLDSCKGVRYESNDEKPAFKKFEANCTSDQYFFLCGIGQIPAAANSGRVAKTKTTSKPLKSQLEPKKPSGRTLSFTAGGFDNLI